jgi:Derlin-2/3
MENTPEQWYKNLPILTRVGLTLFFCITVLVQLEILDPALLFLNWPLVINKLQVWRLLTSVTFFGTFSFQFLFQLYFFSSFSSKLEKNEIFAQPGDYLFFLLVQILLLDVVSLVLAWPSGFPALGPSLVFAILYYWSRREPYAQLNFFSFTIKGYQFPFALVFFQLLIGGNIWVDLLGLASGHIYYFIKEVVPQEYGHTLIKTPGFLVNFMSAYGTGANPAPAAGGFAGVHGGGGGGGGGAPPPPAPPRNFGGTGHRLGGTN